MVVCLFGASGSEYLDLDLDGRSTLQRVAEFVRGLSAGVGASPEGGSISVDRIVVASNPQTPALPDGWERQERLRWTYQEMVRLLSDLVKDAETEIVLGYLDQPFQNLELAWRIITRHRKYRADYTFADGYPRGLAIEVLTGRALAHLRDLAEGDSRDVEREGVFPVVQKDINRLDVETELSPLDQRLLRLDLSVQTRAGFVLCRSLAAEAPSGIDRWQEYVASRRQDHRTLPAFVAVQVVEEEVQNLAYSPYRIMRDDPLAGGRIMDTGRFTQLVSQVAELSPEAHVLLSLWGEVARHPEPAALVDAVLSHPGMKAIVETSGIGWNEESRRSLFDDESGRLSVIVGLDTHDPEAYGRIRGNGYQEAVGFAEAALQANPEAVYVQSVRSTLTEPTLEGFYNHWKERTDHVIIQKYDHFCRALPEIRIGDISPISRFPCWHLQRDLHVLADGTVPLCREDINRRTVLGNVFSDGLTAVWEKGHQLYREHVQGNYPGICGECDEYYTFNF